MERVWAGVDIGKGHHHAVVVDAEGRRLLSRRVPNEEPALLDLLAEVLALQGKSPGRSISPVVRPRCCWPCCSITTSASSTCLAWP